MLVDRKTGSIEHSHFYNIAERVNDGDLFVLNNTRVFPARLTGIKDKGQASIEVFLLRETEPGIWEVLLKPARRVPQGSRIIFGDGILAAEVLESDTSRQKRHVRFDRTDGLMDKIKEVGDVPLPPYIHRPEGASPEDHKRYQTVYARDEGSVAAPTAGLHFTREILEKIKYCQITLHVGYGTFKPVTAEYIQDHEMDVEYFSVSAETASQIRAQESTGNRVIATGTTSARTMEAVAAEYGKIEACEGKTDLFIYPGYQFRVVDGLLTNFHLPGSTLLMLISAFGGMELIREAYRKAVENKYRFYSYGDAMLIL